MYNVKFAAGGTISFMTQYVRVDMIQELTGQCEILAVLGRCTENNTCRENKLNMNGIQRTVI